MGNSVCGSLSLQTSTRDIILLMFDLVLGTSNAKKLLELQQILPSEAIRLTSLAELDNAIDVEETGTTFLENATLKAAEQAIHLKRWVLAEDSGLSVEALQGAPGVYSARFSDPGATDERNNDLLLEKLEGVPAGRRRAFYSCQICLSDPEGNIRLAADGRCYGVIGETRCGSQGFGYDPLFIVPEFHQTFGELGPMVKQAISHRARALRKFIPQLMSLIECEAKHG